MIGPIRWANAGRIPINETIINALMAWANSQERKLSGLGLGALLERSRHKVWANRMLRIAVVTITDNYGRDGCSGEVVIP